MRLEVKSAVGTEIRRQPAAKGNGYAVTHGLRPLREAVKGLGGRVIDNEPLLEKRWPSGALI